MLTIPADHPVQPVNPDDIAADAVATCGACGLSWDDTKATSMTPAPGGRCPFEAFHEAEQPSAAERERTDRMMRYRAAYYAANGRPVNIRFTRQRYRTESQGGIINVYTASDIDSMTLTLEQRSRDRLADVPLPALLQTALDASSRQQMTFQVVPASHADDIGAEGLIELADRIGVPVIAGRESRYHGDKVFWPATPSEGN